MDLLFKVGVPLVVYFACLLWSLKQKSIKALIALAILSLSIPYLAIQGGDISGSAVIVIATLGIALVTTLLLSWPSKIQEQPSKYYFYGAVCGGLGGYACLILCGIIGYIWYSLNCGEVCAD
jgi:hypothetical protein